MKRLFILMLAVTLLTSCGGKAPETKKELPAQKETTQETETEETQWADIEGGVGEEDPVRQEVSNNISGRYFSSEFVKRIKEERTARRISDLCTAIDVEYGQLTVFSSDPFDERQIMCTYVSSSKDENGVMSATYEATDGSSLEVTVKCDTRSQIYTVHVNKKPEIWKTQETDIVMEKDQDWILEFNKLALDGLKTAKFDDYMYTLTDSDEYTNAIAYLLPGMHCPNIGILSLTLEDDGVIELINNDTECLGDLYKFRYDNGKIKVLDNDNNVFMIIE